MWPGVVRRIRVNGESFAYPSLLSTVSGTVGGFGNRCPSPADVSRVGRRAGKIYQSYTAIDHTDEILLLCRASTCTAALDGARQWLHGDEPHHPLDWHPDDLEVPHETYPPALSDRANAYATTGVRRQSVHVYVQHTGRPLSCESDHEPRHM